MYTNIIRSLVQPTFCQLKCRGLFALCTRVNSSTWNCIDNWGIFTFFWFSACDNFCWIIMARLRLLLRKNSLLSWLKFVELSRLINQPVRSWPVQHFTSCYGLETTNSHTTAISHPDLRSVISKQNRVSPSRMLGYSQNAIVVIQLVTYAASVRA